MSAAVAEPHTPAKEEIFQYTNLGPLLFGLLVAFGVGAVVCVGCAFLIGLKAFMFSWLFAFMFFFTLSAGSLFWILVHFAVDAEWSVVTRRLLETVANSFSLLWLFFIPVLIEAPRIYTWMVTPVGADPILDGKRALLDPKFWAIRTVVYLAFFFTVSFLIRRWSTKQDQTGDLGLTTRARGLTFAAIPFFGVFTTFAGIDWVMSISSHWYSTMWGVYIFAGSAWSSMALLILIVRWLHGAGYLKNVITTEHYHIMGKLLLAFTVFWAYIAFDQFFLIWYANIPEETEYFVRRNTESWNTLSILLLVVGHFFVTFALLLPRAAKTNSNRLAYVAGWVLLMHLCDLFIIVMPFYYADGINLFSLIPAAASLVTIGAPLVFVFLQTLGRHSLYALRDPRLAESLRLVN